MINVTTFALYEEEAKKTATYKDSDYLPLGLTEEVGELVHEYARCKRKGVDMDTKALMSEVGDVLWVLSQIAREHDFTLAAAASDNLAKLHTRKLQGTIHEKVGRESGVGNSSFVCNSGTDAFYDPTR